MVSQDVRKAILVCMFVCLHVNVVLAVGSWPTVGSKSYVVLLFTKPGVAGEGGCGLIRLALYYWEDILMSCDQLADVADW
jgi:hypothetical protein